MPVVRYLFYGRRQGNIPTMVVNATKKKSGTSVILLRKVIRKRYRRLARPLRIPCSRRTRTTAHAHAHAHAHAESLTRVNVSVGTFRQQWEKRRTAKKRVRLTKTRRWPSSRRRRAAQYTAGEMRRSRPRQATLRRRRARTVSSPPSRESRTPPWARPPIKAKRRWTTRRETISSTRRRRRFPGTSGRSSRCTASTGMK
jgi:hypothetical protein